MKKTKSFTRALVFSLLTMVLGIALLIGATFAWFTSDVSKKVMVQAGDLKVALEKWNGTRYVDISNEEDPVFDKYEKWEPGYTTYAAIRIVNKGNLALKYSVWVTPFSADAAMFGEVIDVYYLDNGTETQIPKSLEEVLTYERVGTLKNVFETDAVTDGFLKEKGDTDYAIIVLHMQETAGNQYMNMHVEFDISIYATQYTYEKDDFDDPNYDEKANVVVVKTSDDAATNGVALQQALKNAKTGDEIVLPEAQYTATANNQFALRTEGVTIKGAGVDKTVIDGGIYNYDKYAALVIEGDNCTITDLTIKTASSGVAAVKVGNIDGGAHTHVKNATIKNVKLESESGHGLNLHSVDGVTVEGLEVAKYSKCGISIADATGVKLSNIKTAQGGWSDIGFMYKAEDADQTTDYVYERACEVEIDLGSCELGNGLIYSERSATEHDRIVYEETTAWTFTESDQGWFLSRN